MLQVNLYLIEAKRQSINHPIFIINDKFKSQILLMCQSASSISRHDSNRVSFDKENICAQYSNNLI